MILWLVIYGSPTRQFYMTPDALQYLNSGQSRHGILIDPGALSASTTGENANVTFQFDNKSGQCVRLFALPPVGSKAELFGVVDGEAILQFSGIIQSIELDSANCSLQVES